MNRAIFYLDFIRFVPDEIKPELAGKNPGKNREFPPACTGFCIWFIPEFKQLNSFNFSGGCWD